ncbi:MAG: flagellar motor switch protein FliM [Geminicoccaceae bacterium]
MADPDQNVDGEADGMGAEWQAMATGDEAENTDVDALAAEWELPGDDEADDDDTVGRALNQDEIDSLLGVAGDDDGADQSGMMGLINSNSVTYERLPMLEIVFDRLVRILTTSLRNFTSENVDVAIDNITSLRFGDYLDSVPMPAMISVMRAEEWDNYGLVTVDSEMIYSIVDVLLGARRGTAPMRVEGRPYTTIEGNLVTRLIGLILADLSAAFRPVTEVNFVFDRLETNPRFAAIARPGNAAIVFKLRIDMEDRGGCIEFLLPYATLEPARTVLLQMFMGEKFGRDSIWESHLAKEILLTDVELEAVLDQQTISLAKVMGLKVGSVVPLAAKPDSVIKLRCGAAELFDGHMGRIGDTIAVKVKGSLVQPMEQGDG